MAAFFGGGSRHFQRGSLAVHVLPFLPQPDYDRLLWLCDVNFVRGEDSFVRAQWAAKPLVWHIYPQQDQHHRVKLSAFLAHYQASLDAGAARAMADLWLAWENEAGTGASWPAFMAALPALSAHAESWSRGLRQQPDLVTQLLSFSMESR